MLSILLCSAVRTRWEKREDPACLQMWLLQPNAAGIRMEIGRCLLRCKYVYAFTAVVEKQAHQCYRCCQILLHWGGVGCWGCRGRIRPSVTTFTRTHRRHRISMLLPVQHLVACGQRRTMSRCTFVFLTRSAGDVSERQMLCKCTLSYDTLRPLGDLFISDATHMLRLLPIFGRTDGQTDRRRNNEICHCRDFEQKQCAHNICSSTTTI